MTEPRPSRRWPKVLAAVVVVLVLLAVVGVLALDRILLSQARKQADALARDLGRPVAIEGVSTKLLGGLGVRVTGLSVGAGPGEGVPLAELRRAEVEADLLRAVLSRGKDVRIREAVLEGLHVNVVKLPDGTTNVERASKAYAERHPPAAKAPAPEGDAAGAKPKPESDLSFLRIGRAAVENARIAFLDRSVPGAKELFVDDLDVEVRDLAAGRPLELVVKAAVLAAAQNLELRVKAAPLPPSLVPTPLEVVLKVTPIDLDPLAPFAPAAVGLRGGKLQANLVAALGAAAPGGTGPTKLQGGLRATGLSLAGQAPGRTLDVVLDADVEGDAKAGDLRIGKLRLDAGPVALVGRGRVSGLAGDSPRVDGLEVVARGLDLAALSELYPPLRKQLGGIVAAGPIGLSLVGSGGEAAQRIELKVDLGPVRLDVPGELAKAAGAPMALVARADAAGGGGPVRFEASLNLAGADLRPGGTLAKKPGDPLSAKLAGTWRKAKGEQVLELSSAELVLLADRLLGTARVVLGGTAASPTTRFTADLRGDRLDLDRLLIPAPEPAKGGKAPPAPASKPLDPKAFAGLSGTAALRLGLLRYEKVDLRDVVARVKVVEDAVTLEEARLDGFGGRVSAAGTAMKLAHADAPFTIIADVKGVSGEELLRMVSKRKVLSGTLDARLELGGKGMKLDPLAKSAEGTLRGDLRDGAFHGKDLVAAVAGPIAKALPFAAGKVTEGGATRLGKELPFALKIADGAARLEKPLSVDTGQGALSLNGGVKLDGTLDMPATLSLAPELVARLTGGRARPKAPIPVGFRLAGPAWSPRLDGLELRGAVEAIAREAAAGALGRAVGVPGGDVDALAAKKRAEAEAKAKDEAAKATQKLQDQAKKKLRGLFGK